MSKFYTLVCFIFCSVFIFGVAHAAPSSDEQIYSSLKIQEINATQAGIMGASTYDKTIGGLDCKKTIGVYPGAIPSFHCVLGTSVVSSEIYSALNVSEQNITPKNIMGASTYQKQAGDLVCSKIEGVYPGAVASYNCDFVLAAASTSTDVSVDKDPKMLGSTVIVKSIPLSTVDEAMAKMGASAQ